MIYEIETFAGSSGVIHSRVTNIGNTQFAGVETRLAGTNDLPWDPIQPITNYFDVEIRHYQPNNTDPNFSSPFDDTKRYRITIEEIVEEGGEE